MARPAKISDEAALQRHPVRPAHWLPLAHLPQPLGRGSGHDRLATHVRLECCGRVGHKLLLVMFMRLREHDQIDWNSAISDESSELGPWGGQKTPPREQGNLSVRHRSCMQARATATRYAKRTAHSPHHQQNCETAPKNSKRLSKHRWVMEKSHT